jgi:cyclic pyranopterin phosphate synthase
MEEDMNELAHFSKAGRARIVDVSEKPATDRAAIATGILRMRPETLARIHDGKIAKGDVLTVADVGAVMAAKHTADIIPMCHTLSLSGVEVGFGDIVEPDSAGCVGIKVVTTVRCTGRTGVEMEALCAAAVALMTIYDMCKGIDRGMRIESVQLEEKRGGRSGIWRREARGNSGMPPGNNA